MNPKISVLVPVYNGGEFLKKLVECLQNQTFKDFEVIFVDDSSTDGSMEYLQELAKTDTRIKPIHRETKGGTAIKGIVYGLPYCNGEYFFYSSQDDLLDNDCLEKLYNKAVETGADIVVPDMVWFYDDGKDHGGLYAPDDDYEQEMSGKDAFLLSLDWRIHAFNLRKMDFAKKIGWDALYYNSCEYASRIHYFFANKVVFSDAKTYYRQNNTNAITKNKIKPFKLETMLTDLRLIEFMIDNGLTNVPEFKLVYKRVPKEFRSYRRHGWRVFTKDEKAEARRIFNKVQQEYSKLASKSKNLDFKLRSFLLNLKNFKRPNRKKQYENTVMLARQLTCKVGRCTYCGEDINIQNPQTTIGSFCSLASHITIGPGDHPLDYMSTSSFFYLDDLGWNEGYHEIRIKPCHIGNDVWIGNNVFIKGGVTIGDGAVIAAGAVLVKDVPPYSVVGGVPARIIKYRFNENIIKDFLELKWWDLDDDIIKTLPFKEPEKCIEILKQVREK